MGLNAKVKIKREYYAIEQLAERWNVSNDDILHLGITEQLKVNAVSKFQYSKAKFTNYHCQLPLRKNDLAAVIYHKKDYLMYGEISLVFDCKNIPKAHSFAMSVIFHGCTGTIIGNELSIESKYCTGVFILDEKFIVTDSLNITYHQESSQLILSTGEEITVSYDADIKRLIINTDDIERYEKENSIDESITNCDYSQETKASKPSQTTQPSNDCEFSGLLIIPSRIDSWFPVIDDMVRAFYNEKGGLPNEVQAWCRLCENPPAGYAVSTGKDKGENCLIMPSATKPLPLSNFKGRWKRYTISSNKQ